ncbi:helix-turn-helix domain-containing protein [Muribaculum intestinale]|jgi:excisionase family DNA binding protein|uniref:helix-turn-helix domain-containing protein n=2 Tax=Bacteroidales TaxID=171549 RepID=UPI0025B330B1|nr:helix-turn-helix domain-containing protein [Muribaculum intestinale]
MSEDRRITMRLTRIENTLEEIKRTISVPEPPDRPITVREAAEIMHCSEQRVRDSIRDGTLEAKRNGRRYYLSLYDVRERAGFPSLEKKRKT